MTKPRQPLPGDLENLAQRMHVRPPEGQGWEPVMHEQRLQYRRLDADGQWQYAEPRSDDA